MKQIVRVFLILFVTLSIALFPHLSFAENENISFADWLFNRGFYNYARYEYLKDIFDSSIEEEEEISKLYNRVAECYLASGKYGEGIKWCMSINEQHSQDFFPELNITYAILLMKMGHFDKSIEELSNKHLADGPIKSRANFLLGCSEAHQWKLNDAIDAWRKIPSNHQLNPIINEYISYTEKAKQIKFLNPTNGAVLSIIPGLGYLYAGHNKTALSALIVIGLTSWGTVASFKEDINGIGYLTGFLSIGWYSGSIYGSYWACKRKNEYNRRLYLKKIKY